MRSSGSGVEIHCFLGRRFGLQAFVGSGSGPVFLSLLHPAGGVTPTRKDPQAHLHEGFLAPTRVYPGLNTYALLSPGCEKAYSTTPNINRAVNISR